MAWRDLTGTDLAAVKIMTMLALTSTWLNMWGRSPGPAGVVWSAITVGLWWGTGRRITSRVSRSGGYSR